jgi:hypothetical protein
MAEKKIKKNKKIKKHRNIKRLNEKTLEIYFSSFIIRFTEQR